MKALASLVVLLIFITGCASLRVSSDVQAGRQALLVGKSEVALSYFQRAAEQDPNYYYGTALRQGIWSYVGRSEYAMGRYPQARQTLEKALSADKNDNTARLYLGLTLARSGDRQRGLTEIQSGMKGIHGFLEYVTEAFRFTFGQFWDPTRKIRTAIETDLAMISSREFDWDRLIADGEWLGKEIEEESDRARDDETRQQSRENSGGEGKP
jgi:tetratricopeptide (TPR) repeat protein